MTAAAPVRTTRARTSVAARPRLRLIAGGPLTVGRMPFALLIGGILAVGLVGLLMLHTLAAQDAFRLQNLQAQQAALSDTEQQLQLAGQHDQAPNVLARHARQLGMVPTGSIAFVKIRRHGRVVGVVHAAPLPPPPPAPSASASPASDRTTTKPATKPADKPAAGHTDTATAKTKPARHRRADRNARG